MKQVEADEKTNSPRMCVVTVGRKAIIVDLLDTSIRVNNIFFGVQMTTIYNHDGLLYVNRSASNVGYIETLHLRCDITGAYNG